MPEFDRVGALAEGYTDEEIDAYLAQQQRDTLSTKDEWAYVWDASPTMTERAATWLQSRLPLPGIKIDWGVFGPSGVSFTDPVPGGFDSDAQRQAFGAASPDARLEFLKRKRQEQVLLENPEAAEAIARGEDVNNGLVAFAREMADPASLIAPAGTGLRGMALSGSLFGFSYDVIKQAYEDRGSFRPEQTLLSTVVGGVLSPALGKLAKESPELVRVLRGKPTKRSIARADELLLDFEDEFTRLMAKESGDVDPALVTQKAKENLSLSDEDYFAALIRTDREAALPINPAAARQVIEVHEELTNGTIGNYKPMGLAEELFGSISTRVRMIDEGVFGRLRTTEFNIHKNTHDRVTQVQPFIDSLRALPSRQKNNVSRHLANGEFDAVESVLRTEVGESAVENFHVVKGVLDNLYTELSDSGVQLNRLENYFPRQIKDLKGFYNFIGKEAQEDFDKQLAAYAARKGFSNVKKLPQWEKANFTNLYLRGRVIDPAGRVIGHAKARQVDNVTQGLQQFYHDPGDSLLMYLVQATKTAEKYKFFGKKNQVLKNEVLDIDDSVGGLVADRNLSQAAITDLKELLSSRFIAGEVSPHETLQKIRNIAYMTTLANPYSAAIQVADIGLAKFATKGDMLPAMYKSLSGKADVTMDDLGLGNLLVEELNTAATSVGNYSKALNRAMGYGMFKTMDRFGKNTIIQAAFKADQKTARLGGKGLQAFRKEWAGVYGDELDSLVADLKDGVITDNVQKHLWNRLSDVQPISLLEMPKKYLDNPNGRLFYSLKSFGLKQLDLLRREVWQRARKGDLRGSAQAATSYMAYVVPMGLSVNMIRELMQGREVSPADIPDEAIDQMLRLAFMSQYSIEKLGRGGIVDSISNVVAPPLNLYEDGLRDANTIIKAWAEGGDIEGIRTPRNIPIIGKAIYNLLLGGNERANQLREDRRN